MNRKVMSRIAAFVLVLILSLSACMEAFAGYSALRFNDRGSAVVTLQKALKKAGFYSGAADGIYGKNTRNAVKNFQKSVGLTADGVAGNDTQTALYSGKTGYTTLVLGSKGDAVRKLQAALKKLKLYKGDLDGEYGLTTQAAVIAYQKKIGITADGKAGYKTQKALYSGTTGINEDDKDSVITETEVKVSDQHSLYYGCTGSRVRALQYALRNVGCYKGKIDNIYGDLVREAVKKFQRENGLSVDGIAGKATIAKLNKKSKTKVPTTFVLAVGSQGTEVTTVIKFLRARGYTVPSGSTYNTTLETAVKKWQTNNGKTATGTITEAQYNKIVCGQEDDTI